MAVKVHIKTFCNLLTVSIAIEKRCARLNLSQEMTTFIRITNNTIPPCLKTQGVSQGMNQKHIKNNNNDKNVISP